MGLEAHKAARQQIGPHLRRVSRRRSDCSAAEMRATTQMKRQPSEKANYMGGWVNFCNFPTDLPAGGVGV